MIDDLEVRGLVERRADPRDHCSGHHRATRAGNTLFRNVLADVRAANASPFGSRAPEERPQLAQLLMRLATISPDV